MSTLQHILVPTDGSEISFRAAALAGELARAMKARVSIITVHDEQVVIPTAWSMVGMAMPDGSAFSTENVRSKVEEKALAEDLAAAAKAVGELAEAPALVNLWGYPADEICRYAKDSNVDLIVIGCHGRSGVARVLLGSVSNAVANSAPCAVTIVR